MRPRLTESADKVITLAATVFLAANANKYPSEDYWKSGWESASWVVPAALAVAGIFGVIQPFSALSSRSMAQRRIYLQRQLLTKLGEIIKLGMTQVNPPLHISDLALHVWRKRKSLRHPFVGELQRIASYRLGAATALRDFRPSRGVGIIGLCWKENAPCSMDATPLKDRQTFRQESQADLDRVMGFKSYEEFNKVSHRTALFASPIQNAKSKFIGCVSADASSGYSDLSNSDLPQKLNELAESLNAADFRDL
ncbi:hypothetical protein ACWCQZ_10485 [Streptomyces sp. NPDC002285]